MIKIYIHDSSVIDQYVIRNVQIIQSKLVGIAMNR